MSELWRELIERDSPELSGCLTLSRVSISKKNGRMTIELNADRLLSRNDRKRLQRSMEAAFPTVKVDVVLRYPALHDEVQADLGRATKLLKELLSHECPGAVHFIDWESGAWKLSGEKLTLNVNSSEGAEYLRMKGVDALLAGYLKKLFGMLLIVTGIRELLYKPKTKREGQ